MTNQIFALPDLGEGLTEAALVRWIVSVGEQIAIDQPIAEVETAKSIVEVPSPYAGTVAVLHGREGDVLDVGAPLIEVEDGAATAPTAAADVEREAYREEERAGSGNVLIGYGTKERHAGGRTRRRVGAAASVPSATTTMPAWIELPIPTPPPW